jgi:hypothetical protein
MMIIIITIDTHFIVIDRPTIEMDTHSLYVSHVFL